MNEEPYRLEPTEGQHVPTSSAERVVVGFAVLALLSGVVIALGNIFGDESETGAAASPRPTAAASRSARPTPTPRPLREFWLQPGAPEPVTEPSYPFWGWIRPTVDLVIRQEPQAAAPELGILPAGQLAIAEEWPDQGGSGGWLHIAGPLPQGWVATVTPNGDLVERLTSPAVPISGDVSGVVAGAEGFAAYGWSSGLSDRPQPRFVAASADGLNWEQSDAISSTSADQWTAAWGPAGWLALEWLGWGDVPGPDVWVWQSTNGVSWSAMGAMEDLPTQTSPAQLVGSPQGYVMATMRNDGAYYSPLEFWFSPDGVTWSETRAVGIRSDAWVGLAASEAGFYAWDQRPVDTRSRARGAYSSDGRTWAEVTYGPEGPSTRVVAVGDSWVAIDADPSTAAPRVWIAMVGDGRLTWRRDRSLGATFEGAAVSALASDGHRAVAFGWDRSTDEPLVWNQNDEEWTRASLPSDYQGIPRVAAGGPAGFVLVGSRPTSRGSNPIFWHSTDGERWLPEPAPLVPVVPDPAITECGPPPDDAIDFVLLDRAAAPACFGNTPLTVRAWSAPCSGCVGPPDRSGGSQWDPAWLAAPGFNQLFLSPIEDEHGWWTSVVLDPSLEFDGAWVRTWVEVIGHFDDPAASTCRWIPSSEEEQWYSGRRQVIDSCRQQFVVTAVTPVEGG